VTTLPSCADTYGSLTGVEAVCLQTDTTCELRYASMVATCTQICTAGGGTCIGVFDNQGPCGHGPSAPCNTSQFQQAICVCSRGCGSGPPCTAPQLCNGGTCQ
jgi:hypothetical protein